MATIPISFVGYATAESSGTAGHTVDLTALSAGTLQENDLVLLFQAYSGADGAVDVVTPAGYTKNGEWYGLHSLATYAVNSALHYKVMGATPDTSVQVVGGSTANNGNKSLAMVWRGVDTTTPLDVAVVTTAALSASDPSPYPITPISDGAVVVVVAPVAALDVVAYTYPTGYTGIMSAGYDPTYAVILMAAYKTIDPAAYESPARFGGFASAGTSLPLTIALRPDPFQALTATTFNNVPSFPVTPPLWQEFAFQQLSASTWSNVPSFPTATLDTIVRLSGATWSNVPTFPTATARPVYRCSAVVWSNVPTFPVVNLAVGKASLSASLWTNTPSFPLFTTDLYSYGDRLTLMSGLSGVSALEMIQDIGNYSPSGLLATTTGESLDAYSSIATGTATQHLQSPFRRFIIGIISPLKNILTFASKLR